MDPLFPALPEDISAASDEELTKLLAEHESAKELILSEDEKFLEGLDANEILAQLEAGGNQYQILLAEQTARGTAHADYVAKKEELTAKFEVVAEEEPAAEDDDDAVTEEALEVVAEVEEVVEEVVEEEKVLVTASVETPRFARKPPAPSADRTPVAEPEQSTSLVASGEMGLQFRDPLDSETLGELTLAAFRHHGAMPKNDPPGKYYSEQ